MKIKLLFLLLLLPVMAIAQKKPRTVLPGKVVADSLMVDNLTVLNLTSNIRAITDAEGEFTIYARPTDTLMFTGVGVRTGKLVLKDEHFSQRKLLIRLNVDVKMLEELIIKAELSDDLSKASKASKTKNLTSGFDSSKIIESADPKPVANINTALPTAATGSQLTGVDFGKIYKLIFKKKKRKDAGEIYAAASGKTFSQNVKERYTYYFFTETLKIPKDEIGLFLTFCDKRSETDWMLDPKKEFELTDYLIGKSREYLKKEK